MPYLTTTGGLNFQYPTDGTQNWGSTLKTSFNTISAHNHTGAPNGAQLGTNSLQANAVTEPKIRLTNNAYLRGRNAADSADVNILKVNASDVIQIGNSTSNILIDGANINLTGTLTFGSGMPSITFPTASAATPGIAFTGDPDSGFFSSAANTVNLSTGGTERWKVDISAVTSTLPRVAPLGAVGTPSYTFTGDLNTGIYSSGADTVDIATNGVQRVSVSTSATTSTLPIVFPTGSNSAPGLAFSGDLNTGIYSSGADTLNFSTGGSERLQINSTGQVGIGVTPSVELELQQSGDCRIRLESTGGALFDQHIHFKDTASDWYIGNRFSSPTAGFGIGKTNAKSSFIIDENENFGFGVVPATNQRITLNAGGDTSSFVAMQLRDSSANTLINVKCDGLINTGVKASSPYNNTTGTAANMVVSNTGDLQRSTSSQRYKNDIQDLTHGLAEVMRLRPVTFKHINDDNKIFGGLIAEEVDQLGLFEFVVYDEQNRPDAIHYGNMVSLAFKAIQELNARIVALEPQN